MLSELPLCRRRYRDIGVLAMSRRSVWRYGKVESRREDGAGCVKNGVKFTVLFTVFALVCKPNYPTSILISK